LGGFSHHGDDAVPVSRFAQIKHHLNLPQGQEMGMSLDENRDSRSPLQINDCGGRADKSFDIPGCAYGPDSAAFDRKGFGLGPRWIKSHNLSIYQHNIGFICVGYTCKD
jgi:hypothetical protein